ncbi:hypothetical protein GT755_27285 [Herbidospora sp. NEAU-GS84]|uniref:Uncharacterized protein n=1 Tax=Herbidospora solisilvae TaxID=2696284 RepID=A0A7C9NR96_9ACTN|nr:hypothetical protein [Herbidospora solisilvae]NAS25376.1 hypothetical protein [Herbidospora solisilvae]
MTLAHLLEGLRCSCCGALDVLWLDLARGLIECRECGQSAFTFPEIGEGE